MIFTENIADPDAAWSEFKGILDNALRAADQMRRREGEELAREIGNRLLEVERILAEVRKAIPAEGEALVERVEERVRTLAGQVEVSEDRLAQEIAFLSERMDVTEEQARMDSHMVQFGELVEREEPVGRELDFLLQEMNREANTMVSKVHSAAVAVLVVSLKAELEKIREQIQNVE